MNENINLHCLSFPLISLLLAYLRLLFESKNYAVDNSLSVLRTNEQTGLESCKLISQFLQQRGWSFSNLSVLLILRTSHPNN